MRYTYKSGLYFIQQTPSNVRYLISAVGNKEATIKALIFNIQAMEKNMLCCKGNLDLSA
jgi:hypothetical protein